MMKKKGLPASQKSLKYTDLVVEFLTLNPQLDFPSEPGVSNEILENEPKSCLTFFA